MPRTILSRCDLLTAMAIISASFTMGCAHVNNPYKDSSALVENDMTTPSAEGVRGHAEFGRSTRRIGEVTEVHYVNGAVSHWPLWWEDPFEDKGNRTVEPADRDAPDREFVWNWVDYLHMGYGPARMILNTAGWPVSAIVTPPGTLMESNGRLDRNILGYDHDAKRCDSVNREPPDISIINDRTAPVTPKSLPEGEPSQPSAAP